MPGKLASISAAASSAAARAVSNSCCVPAHRPVSARKASTSGSARPGRSRRRGPRGRRRPRPVPVDRWRPAAVRDEPRGVDRARSDAWSDLAPEIVRQRLVIEGVPGRPVGATLIRCYLSALSAELGMVELLEPVTHRSDRYGWAGWIHWRPRARTSTPGSSRGCSSPWTSTPARAFDVGRAVSFTRDFLHAEPVVAVGSAVFAGPLATYTGVP